MFMSWERSCLPWLNLAVVISATRMATMMPNASISRVLILKLEKLMASSVGEIDIKLNQVERLRRRRGNVHSVAQIRKRAAPATLGPIGQAERVPSRVGTAAAE